MLLPCQLNIDNHRLRPCFTISKHEQTSTNSREMLFTRWAIFEIPSMILTDRIYTCMYPPVKSSRMAVCHATAKSKKSRDANEPRTRLRCSSIFLAKICEANQHTHRTKKKFKNAIPPTSRDLETFYLRF